MRVLGGVMLAAVLLFSGAFVFAADNPGQSMDKGAMSEKTAVVEKAKEAAPVAVEVGNKVCPVSGHEVESMGQAVKYEYKGKIYNFCCSGCIDTFKSDPEKYSKIAEESVSK